jgi:hypothetical protein
MKRARIWTVLALGFVTFVSLGATECSDEQRMVFEKVAEMLADHEERIDALERCDCIGILAPVCGEDGNTYVNRCEARCAEAPIAAPGICEDTTCGGEQGIACDPGSFCETRPGCDEMAVGMCQEIPETCTDDEAPVCGCDGVTYANDCARQAAGIALDFRGDCANPPVECADNDECMAEEFCARREGVCDDQLGLCIDRPEVCPDFFDPVCGCDDVSYPNACAAAMAGAAVASEGECVVPPVECTDNAECSDDEFCRKRIDQCDGVGVCSPVPEVCPDVFNPVCGCDGEDYANRCFAAAAGVAIESLGRCVPPVPVCHFPPGNPENFHTIFVDEEDVRAHVVGHGDHVGRCDGDDGDDDSDSDSDRDWYISNMLSGEKAVR